MSYSCCQSLASMIIRTQSKIDGPSDHPLVSEAACVALSLTRCPMFDVRLG